MGICCSREWAFEIPIPPSSTASAGARIILDGRAFQGNRRADTQIVEHGLDCRQKNRPACRIRASSSSDDRESSGFPGAGDDHCAPWPARISRLPEPESAREPSWLHREGPALAVGDWFNGRRRPHHAFHALSPFFWGPCFPQGARLFMGALILLAQDQDKRRWPGQQNKFWDVS